MRTLKSVLTILMVLLLNEVCQAQGMFGERRLGSALNRQARPGASSSTPGVLDGGRRFMRDQRAVTDFVGSVIAGEAAANFVGGQSAVTSAVSSVTGLVEEVRPPLNRPRIIRPTGFYAERLTLASGTLASGTLASGTLASGTLASDMLSSGESSTLETPLVEATLSSSLQSFIQSRSVTIEVSQADRSATLLGAVPSEHDRQTIELFVRLEPGIQTVRNELTVDQTLPPILRRARAPKSN